MFKVSLILYQSLIVLAAVDHKKRFIEVLIGFPGSVNDGRIWANSALNRKLEQFLSQLPSTPIETKATSQSETRIEEIPAFLLGDSAYASTRRMVPMYKITDTNQNVITKNLNEQLAGIRYCIENAFGMLKGRFRVLNRDLECAAEDVKRATLLITSIFTIHNFLIDERDETIIEPIIRDPEEHNMARDEEGNEVGNENTSTRDILWRHRCWYEVERD